MEDSFARIKNYHVSVKEVGNKVVFLRKLKRGGSAHSFGIHVAEMAGMPRKVIERATALLTVLEKSHTSEDVEKVGKLSMLGMIPLQESQVEESKPARKSRKKKGKE